MRATTYGAQGNKNHNNGNPLALPSGPITRNRAKKYGATMSLHIQEQVTQELHDLAFNKCYEELEGTPKFLTLIETHVEWEPELVSTPVQGGTPRACPPQPRAVHPAWYSIKVRNRIASTRLPRLQLAFQGL
ncbi:hypothetical protein JCGZ_06006 [Jatropha curcas]|uniref:Uncharacterized protein n=1 Tax=Jatropha curcas TaxID=180498 RepID=A0A067JLQ6_JATCU|nr:hypothetical protein JCGZ_06006 [Jatropha curcas]